MAATAAKWTTVRLSSGISANILDFGIPQKDVVTDMAAQETGRKAGGGEVQTQWASRPGQTGRGQKLRRFRQQEARA
jgi:hypothetical protein